MNEYLKSFLNVIRNCNVDNTYKMAWAKALVEISCENRLNDKIAFSEIAMKIYKYYWNQTIYFDLIQSSNISKPPEFISEVKKGIEKYYELTNKRKPIHFERINLDLNININKLVRILKDNVSWRFLNLKGEKINLYDYKKGEKFLILKNRTDLYEFSDIIFESINFRWTQILENFNSSPRIAKKVRVLDLTEVKRSSLAKFRVYLDIYNKNHICFICDKQITNETPSIDHVIPWSYLFSDDLWNLVYTHKTCNSKKSNSIPTKKEIEKLENRNLNLYKNSIAFHSKKPIKMLKLAIDRDFVKKFWIGSKN